MGKLKRKRVLISVLIYSTLLFLILLVNIPYIYAATVKGVSGEAETYREKGYEAQERGDIDTAIEWYQKAINLDPGYAAPHNDLGILFETKGWLDRAEAEYQKALAIAHNYKEVHTNLALLYERKGELEKAAFHWMRRYRLGDPNEPWTQEAKDRLVKLGLLEKTGRERLKTGVIPSKESAGKKVCSRKKTSIWTRIVGGSEKKKQPLARCKSSKKAFDKELEESLRLAEERLKRERSEKVKTLAKKEPNVKKIPGAEASLAYNKAKDYYNKGEYSKALDTIRSAKKSSSEDSSLLELEGNIKNKMKEERIQDHYNEGMIHYRQKDYQGARKEFEAILSILPE